MHAYRNPPLAPYDRCAKPGCGLPREHPTHTVTAADIVRDSTPVGTDAQGRTIMHSPALGRMIDNAPAVLARIAASRDRMDAAERSGLLMIAYYMPGTAPQPPSVLHVLPGYEPESIPAVKIAERYDARCRLHADAVQGDHWHCANCGGLAGVQGHFAGDPPVFSCAAP